MEPGLDGVARHDTVMGRAHGTVMALAGTGMALAWRWHGAATAQPPALRVTRRLRAFSRLQDPSGPCGELETVAEPAAA